MVVTVVGKNVHLYDTVFTLGHPRQTDGLTTDYLLGFLDWSI